jgi:hypothetical protein
MDGVRTRVEDEVGIVIWVVLQLVVAVRRATTTHVVRGKREALWTRNREAICRRIKVKAGPTRASPAGSVLRRNRRLIQVKTWLTGTNRRGRRFRSSCTRT